LTDNLSNIGHYADAVCVPRYAHHL
jgi:hypothetical protein